MPQICAGTLPIQMPNLCVVCAVPACSPGDSIGMKPATQILLSGALTFGVPLALAIRDLIIMRRPPGGFWRPEPPEARRPPPNDGGCPTVPALPQCLLDAAMGDPSLARIGTLEHV